MIARRPRSLLRLIVPAGSERGAGDPSPSWEGREHEGTTTLVGLGMDRERRSGSRVPRGIGLIRLHTS